MKALVVDSSNTMRSVLRRILTMRGFEVTEADNYQQANPLVTPPDIVPEWYLLPFYAMLRSWVWDIDIPFTHIVLISSKLGGVILMFMRLHLAGLATMIVGSLIVTNYQGLAALL